MSSWYFTSLVLCASLTLVIHQREAMKLKFWEKDPPPEPECPPVPECSPVPECPPVEDCSSQTASDFPKITAPRRYDIKNMGDRSLFHGWVDVQGQGAANDFCRIVGVGKEAYLACALAGTQNQSDTNYVSQLTGFDRGYTGTWYMKDEDNDGRDDYCRCVGNDPTIFTVCTKSGPKGFYGSTEQGGKAYTFNITGADSINCINRKVMPETGQVYA